MLFFVLHQTNTRYRVGAHYLVVCVCVCVCVFVCVYNIYIYTYIPTLSYKQSINIDIRIDKGI
jgi:hypothetical protein